MQLHLVERPDTTAEFLVFVDLPRYEKRADRER